MSGNNLQILPVLDTEVLKEKAQAAAMKGAEEAIKEYYTGYKSPFIKAITEELENQKPGLFLQLPDIIGLINDSLSKRIDEIANAAVAQSFVPMVNKILTRAEKDVKFSDILQQFVDLFEDDKKHPDAFECTVRENTGYGWLDVSICCDGSEYNLTLHKDRVEAGQAQTYSLLSLPRGNGYKDSSLDKMTLHVEGAKLELPFIRDILSNDFMAYCARLIMCESNLHIDTREFQDWMFPEDGCHCH